MSSQKLIVIKLGESALGRSSHLAQNLPQILKLIQTYQKQGYKLVLLASALRGHSRKIRSIVQKSLAPEQDFSQDLFYFGEFFTCSLLERYLNAKGALSQALCFDKTPTHLRKSTHHFAIDHIDQKHILNCLKENSVPIIPGFIGLYNQDYKSLEFDGSDLCAVHLSIDLNAEHCIFIKHPGALHTVNPKIVNKSQVIDALNYDQLALLNLVSNPIIHQEALTLAQKNNVSLVLRSYEPTLATSIHNQIWLKPLLSIINQKAADTAATHNIYIVYTEFADPSLLQKTIESALLLKTEIQPSVISIKNVSEPTLKVYMQKLQDIFQHLAWI